MTTGVALTANSPIARHRVRDSRCDTGRTRPTEGNFGDVQFLARLARETAVEVLDVDHPQFRLYRLA